MCLKLLLCLSGYCCSQTQCLVGVRRCLVSHVLRRCRITPDILACHTLYKSIPLYLDNNTYSFSNRWRSCLMSHGHFRGLENPAVLFGYLHCCVMCHLLSHCVATYSIALISKLIWINLHSLCCLPSSGFEASLPSYRCKVIQVYCLDPLQ